ncbi:MAG TPA: MBL fold metallo-hydrolase [Microbacterium sp.]|nr:MBL fold metallo-hydrolase [Microbacterium sp.]
MNSLRHYACGHTHHNARQMFRGAPNEVRRFPSGALLYDTGTVRVLFDTGYRTGAWHAGWRAAAYRTLLPPVVVDADDIAAQLRGDGVDPATVTHVVLSHLHPDHIGGVHRFPGARFVLTAPQLVTLAAPGIRSGVLPGLLPDWFDDADRLVVNSFDTVELAGRELRAHDLLGDGSYLLVSLPGHAAGHIGALVERRVLLAGDAAWGLDLIDGIPRMRPLPRAVQHDVAAYRDSAELVGALAASGVRVVFSHDPVSQRELL